MRHSGSPTVEEPVSVTVSDIYVAKMENDIVIWSKPIFYGRFVDDHYSRWKLEDKVLFERLTNHHPNIKLTHK